jgi:hypothetical protein
MAFLQTQFKRIHGQSNPSTGKPLLLNQIITLRLKALEIPSFGYSLKYNDKD